MKETINSPATCQYTGNPLTSDDLMKIIEVMMSSVSKEELHKYKITIDFKE